MSKVMVDTDIWVDIILARPQFVEESKGAIMACIEEGDEILIPATSLKDVFYFATKSAGSEAGYRAVKLVLDVASVAQVDNMVCRNALDLEHPDYEDGIVSACMQAEGASCIITRDVQSFNELSAAKLTPAEYLSSHGFESCLL